jgi:hypothetical protein
MMHALNGHCIHALRGRLRLKIRGLRRSPSTARQLEGDLRAIDGVTQVEANPLTGNVLICYDPDRLPDEAVVSRLQSLGHLPKPGVEENGFSPAPEPLLERLAVTLAFSLITGGIRDWVLGELI